MLERAATRDEVIDAASRIRLENAQLGFRWTGLAEAEKADTPRPLTSKEMQFLFTEVSPGHYTTDMTVARISYSHSGTSRRMMTDALMKGEIKPGNEAQRLVDSLESRLERRHLKDSITATRHFLESIRTPHDELRFKNSFDHKELYSKLPPHEKDFVYQSAVQQRSQLEDRSILLQQPARTGRVEITRPEFEPLEKAASLRDVIKSDLIDLLRENSSMNRKDLIDQMNQKLTRRLTDAGSMDMDRNTESIASLSRKIGDMTENVLRFNGHDSPKTRMVHVEQSDSANQNRKEGRTTELGRVHNERQAEQGRPR
jgi:hypothetical protein